MLEMSWGGVWSQKQSEDCLVRQVLLTDFAADFTVHLFLELGSGYPPNDPDLELSVGMAKSNTLCFV